MRAERNEGTDKKSKCAKFAAMERVNAKTQTVSVPSILAPASRTCQEPLDFDRSHCSSERYYPSLVHFHLGGSDGLGEFRCKLGYET